MKTDYRLLDTGGGRRLELFGDIRLVRNAKQADHKPALPESEWKKAAAVFDGESWHGEVRDFTVSFNGAVFSLALLEAGQVGIFPEQEENWEWLRKTVGSRSIKIMNGFAYTGGSTIFASTPHTDVTHLDASKPAVTRAAANINLSGKGANSVRFIVDDVITFMEKEVRRGKSYGGFIFDPPAFGRGGKGKTWKITRDLPKLADLIRKLSGGAPGFILLSAHEPELEAEFLADIIKSISTDIKNVETGVLRMRAESGNDIDNGYFARYAR